MQTIVSTLESAFRDAIREAFALEADPLIGLSQNQTFGDYQSNAAMSLAKRVSEVAGQKTNPRAVAEKINAALNLGEIASETSIAGPGFINVRLSPAWVSAQLTNIAADPRLGVEKPSATQTVVIDYSGPNIAKQMHVGHLRSTIIGDALARVLEFQGHTVIRQNHVGDWGTQFGMVILGIWHIIMANHRGEPDFVPRMNAAFEAAKKSGDAAARQKLIAEVHAKHQAALDADPDGQKIFVPAMKTFVPRLEDVEPAYKFVNAVEDAPESAALSLNRGSRSMKFSRISNDVIAMLQAGGDENAQEERVWEKVREASLDEAQKVYERLHVNLTPADVRGESWYRDRLPGTVHALSHPIHNSESEQVHIAVHDSDGAVVVFHKSPAGAPLFLNKEGEPLPFLVKKSDGAFLYSTTDLAALRYRIDELHADRLVYVIGAPQSLHLEMLFATSRGAGWTLGKRGPAILEHVAFGSMLGEDGKPFKTRSGESVKLADLLDEAIRRTDAVVRTKRNDFAEEQFASVANSVAIGAVKYADLARDRVSDYLFSWEKMLSLDGNTAPYLQYAHARIQSIIRKAGGRETIGKSLMLEAPQELAIAKHIMRLSDVIAMIARDLKPHTLCTYLYELASKFSSFYDACPVNSSAEPVRSSRLLLCELTARTLQIGLELLGIEHPDEM